MKLQKTPIAPAHSLHHASTSGSSTALLASSSVCWIIDSRASAHMSSTQPLLTRLSKLSQPSSISIVDGCACSVVGHGEANLASSLQLSRVLCVPYFFVNLLSIIAITISLFAPSHYFLTIASFRICGQGRGLACGMRLDVDFISLSLIIF